jgi:hypothetical protein
VDLAASASKAARAAEPETAQGVIAASIAETAAYSAGVLAYLAQGKDFEAVDLAEHVRLCPSLWQSINMKYDLGPRMILHLSEVAH